MILSLTNWLADHGHPIVWRNLVGAKTGLGGKIIKTSNSGWNSGAISSFRYGGDIAIQFKCHPGQSVMLGMSKRDLGTHFKDIECALYCDEKTLKICESTCPLAFQPAWSSAIRPSWTCVT